MTNIHETAARQAKILALLPVVQQMAVANGKSPLKLAQHLVAVADPGLRARVCEFAGINPASATTWAALVEHLERAEKIADPFARFDRIQDEERARTPGVSR